jgi:hypothetical protein
LLRRGALAPGVGVLLVLAMTTVSVAGCGSDDSSGAPYRDLTNTSTVQDTGQLVDVASAVGLDMRHGAFRWGLSGDPVAMMGGGLCWIDVDRDGWLDLFVTNTWAEAEWATWNSGDGVPQTRLFRNDGGTFTDATEEWGAGFAVRGLGCTVADFDRDGFADLYVTTARANLFLRNNSGAGFTDMSEEADLALQGWQAGAAAGDLNGDGLVDLFVAGYADLNRPRTDSDSGFPNTVEARPDLLMFGTGVEDGVPQFGPNVAATLGIEPDGPEYGLDVVFFDADGDGDLDVHVANDTQANRLYRNDLSTDGGFVDIAAATELADEGSGMGVAVGDLDADDRPDLAVTNLAGQGHRLFVSDGAGSEWANRNGELVALGMDQTGWGVAFADLDSDGIRDVVVASGDIPIVADTAPAPVTIFRGALVADDTTDASDFVSWDGLGDLPARNGRGVAPADFDNDGDVDIAIAGIGEPLVLLENRLVQGASLTVDAGSLPAGTVVEFDMDDGHRFTWRATSGGGWLSGADHRPRTGVGASEVKAIRITEPGEEVVELDSPGPQSRVLMLG